MTDVELASRLLLSLLFGALIGIERQWHHKNAGLKTNTLVAVGATAFALISQHGFGPNSNPAQVAAGVVTGIGFIGGGVIMRRSGNVQGINTAATLWATSSLGLAIGIGYYNLAWLLLGIILLIQLLLRWVAVWIDKLSGATLPLLTYHLAVNFASAASGSVRAAYSDFVRQRGVCPISYQENQADSTEAHLEAAFQLSQERARDLIALGQTLTAIDGVKKAHWSQITLEDEKVD